MLGPDVMCWAFFEYIKKTQLFALRPNSVLNLKAPNIFSSTHTFRSNRLTPVPGRKHRTRTLSDRFGYKSKTIRSRITDQSQIDI
jgi:hypothetical protein